MLALIAVPVVLLVLFDTAVTLAVLRRLRGRQAPVAPPPPRPGPGPGTDPGGPEVGAELPEFAVETADGLPLHSGDLSGRRALLGFFSSSCPGCAATAPEYASVAAALVRHGTRVVSVLQVSSGDDPTAISTLLAANGDLVRQTAPLSLIRDLGVRALPAFFVLDERGLVEAKSFGLAPHLALLAASPSIAA